MIALTINRETHEVEVTTEAKDAGHFNDIFAKGEKNAVIAEYEMPLLAHATVEPLNCSVHVTPTSAETWIGTQVKQRMHVAVAKDANLPENRVTIRNHVLDEDFGRKLERPGLPPTASPHRSPLVYKGGLAPWQVKRLRAYIELNVAQRLHLTDLAGVVSLSPSHFSRAFKSSFGTTVHRYVMNKRIERAQNLMLKTSDELSQIAISCGMSDQSHLTRWFRRVVGETPARWRSTSAPRAMRSARATALPALRPSFLGPEAMAGTRHQ
jgi:transcriptional regulator GlxA family with amidase domain